MIQIKESYPLFITNNLSELKDFYGTHFGFTDVFFDPEFYLLLIQPDSGSQISFMVPDHPSQPAFLHTATSNKGQLISFEVADAKAAWQEIQNIDLDVALEYTEEVWGQNHFIIRDPQGLLIDIVEDAAPVIG